MKIPKLFKKAAAFVMAAVTALSIMPATAFAAGDIGTISFSHTYDSNGNAMRYNSSANIGGYTAGGTGNYKYRMFVDGENAFCIQPGVPLKTGNTLKKASSDTWNALSANQKKAVGLALLYGYQGNRNNLSGSDDEKWLATQTLVWEFVTGCREATGSYNQTSTTVYSLHFGSNYANSGARAVYDQIVAMLREHNTIPSFMSGGKNDITKELAYKDGKYSITLNDSNGVLSDYSFLSSDSNVSVSKSGNMATENDWYRTAEEAEEKPQAYADKLNGSEAPVIEMEQSTDDLIGREIIIDNRKYLIESIGKISGDVSLCDITFQNNVGFPINRVEKIEYIQKLLEQEKTELLPEEKTEAPATDRHNFRITDDAIGIGGAKEKFRNNMAAINLLHELEIENRLATPEEQEVLSRYVGWGGLSMAFDEHNAAWAEEFKELYASLSPEEYRAAMESTLTAFYTPPVVIKAMYDALDRLGFSQGNILEPSCGTGNFFGLLPESMQNSKLHGVEIDSLTGRIAKQLYQKANIAIEGFEKTNLPDDHFDVVIGNVPFGEIRVNDSRYNAQKFFIHDYFFAKALDKVRAGGVVMFITSKGTMDKASPEVRKYIAQRAELLGAIRLPDNTFKANAGTEVTSDILILQKRDRVIDIEPDWVHLDTDENGVTMNRYFVEHPEMVLGEIKMESTRFGTFEPVCKARKDIPLSELLSNAVQRINGEIPELDNGVDEISDEQELSVPADPNVRNFSFTLVDGRVCFRENDRMHPASVSMTAENRIKGLIQIRDCVRKLIEYQTEDYPEEMICTEQENLNRLYDAYTAKYGLINSRGNYLAFASDESYFLLCSLEVLDDEGNFKRKADMFTKRTIKPHREITSVETASEALALSIGEKARVDLPYMEQLTGKTQAELVQDLQGVIFKVPNCEPVSYVAADEYLSGNVRNKLTVAELASKNDPELAVNVEALKKVIPKDLSAAEISVRLGATWIPQEDIQRFVMELLTPSSYAAGRLKVRYTPINGDWFIENKSSDMGNVKADSTYGTKRASAYRIIEDTLNLRDTRIFDYELIDNTCSEMMASGDSFRQYLDVQGCFDRYSVANAILVSAQMPEATQLKEYSKWKANRVYVNKDAQKIIILEPSKEYTREDGTKGVSYNAKVVYDISETSAKDRQQEQEPKSMRELVSALIDASPVPCVPVGELELPAYYDSSQQTIFVKKGLSEEVLFMSMAKEVSAAVYDFKYNESRDVSDFKSFCVAYMVSSRYGMDTRGFDFSRLPREYAEMDTQAFKGELGTMRDVLGEIQSDILNSLEFVQSYGINLICIEEGIDSSQTSGKLLISVLSAVAEIERENIIEQTMNGRREKAR